MKDLIIDCFAGGGADWKQCCADHGAEAGGSELPVPEGWGTDSELQDRGRRDRAD